MATFSAAVKALFGEPMAIVMAAVSLGCVLGVLGSRRLRQRLFLVVMALLTALTSWMMASNWRWPR